MVKSACRRPVAHSWHKRVCYAAALHLACAWALLASCGLIGSRATSNADAWVSLRKLPAGRLSPNALASDATASPRVARLAQAPSKALATDIADGRIFVSVAAYCDPEVPATLRALLHQAERPELLRVGLVWQGDGLCLDENDLTELARLWGLTDVGPARTLEPIAFHDGRSIEPYEIMGGRLRIVRMPPEDARGPCWARYLAQLLWAGEDLYLQLDSHHRFMPQWDRNARGQLAFCAERSSKPVLSGYGQGYKRGTPWSVAPQKDLKPLMNCAQFFDSDGILLIQARELKHDIDEPMPSHFWSGQFHFSSAEVLREVPYDPHLQMLFFGEEILMSTRLFTHGWDLYSPSGNIFFHLWERGYRPVYWKDIRKMFADLLPAAQRRVHHFLGSAVIDSPDSPQSWPLPGGGATEAGVEGFGLGSVRTVADFERAAGVDFQNHALQPRALCGGAASEDIFVDQNDVNASPIKFIGLPDRLKQLVEASMVPGSANADRPTFTVTVKGLLGRALEAPDPTLSMWHSDVQSHTPRRYVLWYSAESKAWVLSLGGVVHGIGSSATLILVGQSEATHPTGVEKWNYFDRDSQRWVWMSGAKCVLESHISDAAANLDGGNPLMDWMKQNLMSNGITAR